MKEIKKRLLNKFKKNSLNKQTLFVVSYPKSGRSWLRVILSEFSMKPHFIHDGAEYYKQRTADTVAEDIYNYRDSKIVFLCRDPRDTLVSNYFQSLYRQNVFNGDISEYIRDAYYGIEKICKFNRAWIDNALNVAGFYLLKYEDLHENPHREISNILNFIGTQKMSSSKINKAINKNEFHSMKKREETGELGTLFPGRFGKTSTSDDSMKVRRGIVGGYSDYLEQADIAYCNDIMEKYGYYPDKFNMIETGAPWL